MINTILNITAFIIIGSAIAAVAVIEPLALVITIALGLVMWAMERIMTFFS